MVIEELKPVDVEKADILANWYHNWWSNKKSIKYIKKELFNKENVIINKVLLDDNEVIGAYQLLKCDGICYGDNLCWLANIYIREDKRGLGYGSILINDSIKQAKLMGYTKLYLHSKHINLYEKFGFKLIDEVEVNGKLKRIFCITTQKDT